MNKYIYSILILILALLSGQNCQAQISSERQARQALEERGIDERELSKRLLAKGIDLDNLSGLSPSEAMEVQKTIEETILEIEQDKAAQIEEVPGTEVEEEIDARRSNPSLEEENAINRIDSIKKEPKRKIDAEIYGQQLFKGQNIRVYNQSQDVKPSQDYILGPNDEIVVSIWGLSRKEETLIVNPVGYVKPSRMPRVFVKGFTLAQVKEILRQRYGNYYRFRPNEFEISLKYSRVIEVNIFGEVQNYGGFTLPAKNTGFNALVAAGGPTELGSVRRIKLIRGREVRFLDVYRLINDPSVALDYYLQDNDVIQVPVANFVVDIQGEVGRPFKYELIEGEGLVEAIAYAGGLKDNALRSRVRILRYTEDQQVLLDANYGDLVLNGDNFLLRHGDIIQVDSIQVARRNVVSVSGAVDYPGEYDINQSNVLSDVLVKAGLNAQSRKDIAFVKRTNPDSTISFLRVDLVQVINENPDYILRSGDEVIVFELSSFIDKPTFTVQGSVRNPSIFDYNYEDQIRLSEALSLSGGLKRDAETFGYVTREDSINLGELQYIRVNFNEALRNPSSTENIMIQPNDVITIGSVLFEDVDRFVDVSGAVKLPGRYDFGNGMSLRDALSLAGGLSFNAASNRIDIFRVLIEENQPTRTVVATVEIDRFLNEVGGKGNVPLEPYDQIFVRQVPEFEFQKNVVIEGEVKYPGTYSITGNNEKIASIIQRAGGLTEEAFAEGATLFRVQDSIGFVVIDLEEALGQPTSQNNILLREGDVLEIPKQQDLVRIIGFTNASDLYPDRILNEKNGIAVPFHPGKNARYYIDEFAAGVGEEGDLCSLTVEHANGQIEKVRNYGLFKQFPKVKRGSVIRVGKKKEDPDKAKKDQEKEEVDWGKVFANSVAQATTILSLILLLQRID